MKKITLLLSAMLMTVMSFAATTVTMDFTSKAGLEKLGIAYPADSTTTEGAYQTELVAGQAYTQEGVSLTATHGSTPTRIWLTAKGGLDLRHNKTGVLTFAAPAGKVILKVKMSGGSVAGFADAPGGVWAGEAATVALAADASASTIKIKTIEVIYGDAGEDVGGNEGGGTGSGETTLVIPDEAKGWNIPAEAIDVLQAREICAGLADKATSGTKYYVMGYVKKLHEKYHESGVSGYGNATFYMENVKGAGSMDDFLAFQVYGLDAQKISDPNVVAEGDFVVVYGELTNYGGTYETVGKGAAYIWNSTNPLIAGDPNVVNVEGMQYADASYYTEDEIGYFDFDMYVDVDPDTYEYTYPELYVAVKANSKTALNGTYDLLYACLWTSVNDSIEMGEALGTVTIKNVDTEGNYSFKGSFVGADGKTYKFNDVMYVWGYDLDNDEEIAFSEESTTPPTPPTGMITCAEAATIAAAENYKGTENVTVYGYVVELGQQKVDDKSGRNKQTFWLSDENGGVKQFQAFWAYVPDFFQVGDKVAVTGILQNYKGTIEISDGEATLLGTTAVEDVTVGATPVKVIENGQVLIIRGEHIYNVLGAQVK